MRMHACVISPLDAAGPLRLGGTRPPGLTVSLFQDIRLTTLLGAPLRLTLACPGMLSCALLRVSLAPPRGLTLLRASARFPACPGTSLCPQEQ